MPKGINKTIAIADEKTEDKWQIEDDARTIKSYFDLKGDKDRYEKAIAKVKEENKNVAEALAEASDYKNKIGFSKK